MAAPSVLHLAAVQRDHELPEEVQDGHSSHLAGHVVPVQCMLQRQYCDEVQVQFLASVRLERHLHGHLPRAETEAEATGQEDI